MPDRINDIFAPDPEQRMYQMGMQRYVSKGNLACYKCGSLSFRATKRLPVFTDYRVIEWLQHQDGTELAGAGDIVVCRDCSNPLEVELLMLHNSVEDILETTRAERRVLWAIGVSAVCLLVSLLYSFFVIFI